jgi:LmbE family N-acetylglucosaminyl deacetylase
MFGKRILILVAHPDDEVVACASAIARAKSNGAEVFTLYLTHGCIARDVMWPWQRAGYDRAVLVRRAEATIVAQLLHITPIAWAARPARYLWRELPDVMREIEAAVSQCRPDQIWAPAYEGGNPDHDALNAVAFTLKKRLSVLEFAEYNFYAGKVHSQNFIASDETVRVITLTPDERETKWRALRTYASERENLSAISCEQESYRPLASYDYTQPPHPGKLWYARFQWVPFKHPRVDFTDAADVSVAITGFLGKQHKS